MLRGVKFSMSLDLQRGSLIKRLAAWILDFMLVLTLVVGLAAGLSALLKYDQYYGQLNASYDRYQTQYGIEFNISQEAYEALPAEKKAAFDEASKAINADADANYAFTMIVNLSLLIASGSILVATLIVEFALPLMLGNGQTLGKKVFGLGVVRVDGVKANNVQLFIRSVLGKFAVETMIPVYVVLMLYFQTGGMLSVILALAVILTQLVLLVVRRDKALIHDLMAGTVVIDLATTMVFNTTDDLIAYKNKCHAEEVSRQDY